MKGKKSLAKTRDTLLEAMGSELYRCYNGFKEKSIASADVVPFFMAFNIMHKWYAKIIASSGAIDEATSSSEREGRAEVRVGTYKDNGVGSDAALFPYDQFGDIGASLKSLRLSVKRGLWQLSEEAFKSAINDYNERKGKRAYEFKRKLDVPDFSIEKQSGPHIDEVNEIKIPLMKWENLLREASSLLYSKEAFRGEASLYFWKKDFYHVDTEERKVVHQNAYFLLQLDAFARGIDKDGIDDGTEVNARKIYHARTLDGLPSPQQIISDAKNLKKELRKLRRVPLLSELKDKRPITCPAILHPDIFGTYLHEAIGHRLEVTRQDSKEIINSLEGLLGQEIMPKFLSLDFDPTIKEFPKASGKMPYGHYKFDAEGLKSRCVSVVRDGILVNYLRMRMPVYDPVIGKVFKTSNAHARLESFLDEDGNAIDPSPRMSTLVVKSKCKSSYENLRKRAASECKRQGIKHFVEIESAEDGYTILEPLDESYGKEIQFSHCRPGKIYLVNASTGKKTRVRGVSLASIPLQALQSIIATDNKYELVNGICDSDSGDVPVSEICPKALISEVTLIPTESRNASFVLCPPKLK